MKFWDKLSKKELSVMALIALILFIIYFANFRLLFASGDTIPSKYVALSLIKEGNMDLDEYSDYLTKEYPYDMQNYGDKTVPYFLVYGNGISGGHVTSAYDIGNVLFFLVPYFIVNLFFGIDADNYSKIMFLSKFTMVTISVLSALLVYLIASKYKLKLTSKLLLTFAFALGTPVLSMFSQDSYQHGPGILMILLGIYFVLKDEKNGLFKYSFIPFSFAVLIRLTNAVLIIPLILYGFFTQNKKEVIKGMLFGVPFVVFLLSYNFYYFGSFLDSARGINAHHIAYLKTGSPEVFQTNFFYGLAGNLFSPSRGLLVYSPFLLFAFLIFKFEKTRDKKLAYLLFFPCVFLIAIPHALHFDWWGGYSYGNRFLAESIPFLITLLIINFKTIEKSRFMKMAFIVFVVISIFVQGLGFFLYDNGWNISRNIDKNPSKNWDIKDRQINYYISELINGRTQNSG